MADRYKRETSISSDGTKTTIVKKQDEGFWGGYSDHSKITEKPNGDVKVEKSSDSFWNRWE